MYSVVLLLHSWLRWLVILFALLAIAQALAGTRGRASLPGKDLAGTLFLRTLDVQFLLGLLLYFVLSPITRAAMSDFGGAMRDSVTRFWAVEHVLGMVIGLALAHIGHARARRVADAARRTRITVIFFSLALVAILLSIPWPNLPAGRPLLRW